MRVGMPLFF